MTTQNNAATHTLDDAIQSAFNSLAQDDPTTDDYTKVVDNLTKLYKMKEIENTHCIKLEENTLKGGELAFERKQKLAENAHKETELSLKQQELDNFNRVSLATVATIVANLAGIAVIMSHERTHIIATKALGFVSKLK
jgi:hypothetical protein